MDAVSRKMGPPYAAYVVITECGLLFMVQLGGFWFLNGSITASTFLLFAFIGSLYLTELRPFQELGSNFAQVLKSVTKTNEFLDIPVYEGGADFPDKSNITLDHVTFSYDGEKEVYRRKKREGFELLRRLATRQIVRNLLKPCRWAMRQRLVRMEISYRAENVIAHTLSIVQKADQIVVVSGGRVVESGTHEELLASNGKYAMMWKAEKRLSAQ